MPLTFAFLHLLSLPSSLAAAACVYLFLLNRRMIGMRDGPYKLMIIRSVMAVMGVGAAVFGYAAAGTQWVWLPVAVLAAAAAGEVRRLAIRRRCRGEPPVVIENRITSLRQPEVTTDLAVARYELRLPGWYGRRLRIAHASDLHVNSYLPLAYFQDAMRQVAAAEPDLLLITGDFLTYPQYAGLLPGLLSLARGRLGTFGVLGNHDDWAGSAIVKQVVQEAGVTLLGNGHRRVATGNGADLLVCGCEEPWTRDRWRPPTVTSGQLALMLTHTPDNIYRLSKHGFSAVFAGHYHAGQVRIPWLGSLVVPSNYGRRFDHGHFVVNGTHLFVTAGVGSAEPPRRIYCQPDLFIVDLLGNG